MMHAQSQSNSSASGLAIGVVASRYHEEITRALVEGARKTFQDAGGDPSRLIVIEAPGAFELPVLAAEIADRKDIDAVVAIGCIIAGETMHDRHIAASVANGLQQVAIEAGKPVAFGVLTCETIEQARARAGGEKGNKGAEAMSAAIEAAGALRALRMKSARGGR